MAARVGEEDAVRAARALTEARARTVCLIEGLSHEALVRQHSPLMSPLVWDLGHLANYEEQWLLRALGAPRLAPPEVDALYDAVRHPRSSRERLPLPPPDEARAYLDAVRARSLEWLACLSEGRARAPDGAAALLRDGFVWGMVAQHEHQHVETMLAAVQLMPKAPLRARVLQSEGEGSDMARVAADAEVFVPAGPCLIGTDDEPWAYDNERPAHAVDVPSFRIDRHPVTNGRYLDFIEDGGYARRELWSEAGWAHRAREGLQAPLFWEREGSDWFRLRFGVREPVPRHEPVVHVCWYEAAAFARWAERRLPTELEWEKAASWDPHSGRRRRFPWGDAPPSPDRANLCTGRWGPSPIGSHPAGASAVGCEGMLGDVWEWTASSFRPWPGFRAFPYPEYSEVFFGDRYRVLRGGAWSTHPLAIRNSFRNWDFPIRRQIFAGFRCARDA